MVAEGAEIIGKKQPLYRFRTIQPTEAEHVELNEKPEPVETGQAEARWSFGQSLLKLPGASFVAGWLGSNVPVAPTPSKTLPEKPIAGLTMDKDNSLLSIKPDGTEYRTHSDGTHEVCKNTLEMFDLFMHMLPKLPDSAAPFVSLFEQELSTVTTPHPQVKNTLDNLALTMTKIIKEFDQLFEKLCMGIAGAIRDDARAFLKKKWVQNERDMIESKNWKDLDLMDKEALDMTQNDTDFCSPDKWASLFTRMISLRRKCELDVALTES